MIEETCRRIERPDPTVGEQTQRLLDALTKPRGSLGRLEQLACSYATMRGQARPAPPVGAIVVMAGDHGVVVEGVSAYPSEVTAQMVANFAAGGAAINVLARAAGARLEIVDMGVGRPTANLARGPAMSREQASAAVERGIGVAQRLAGEGVTLIGTGDMGIGNTTPSSAMTAALLGLDARRVTGRGTGLDEAGLLRKAEVIERALAIEPPDPVDGLAVLARYGGTEIAGLAGLVLGAAAQRVPLLLDGLITSAAALAAVRIAPAAGGYLIASHRSVEIAHSAILEHLGLVPLLELELRLGEGTGAALALPLVCVSVRLLHEMATFEQAEVTDAGA